MAQQVVLEPEGEATGRADKRLGPGVNRAVLGQAHLALEALAAQRAGEGPPGRVRPAVGSQVAGSAKALAAGGAGVGPGPRVHSLVLLEAPAPREAPATHLAREALGVGVAQGGGQGDLLAGRKVICVQGQPPLAIELVALPPPLLLLRLPLLHSLPPSSNTLARSYVGVGV